MEYELSSKEMNIIRLVADGLNNKEIASSLYLSEGTVRNYISSNLDKLQLRDRTQLPSFYYKKLTN
ncbi:MAG: response regulator transcription factor, partial [Coprococcus sp.]